ncbi:TRANSMEMBRANE PROTEIN [Salix purpurea]|uniref:TRANSMEMBRANE PROTEIN n=1 Tax=Salix purpurea TaxID=77065 RepID=A0A9Q0TWU2_SALPP|nr:TRANSMEMBRANE PROTEIN [Salix purpurea]KAJ6719281.1 TRANSMEMBRANE PROTEIN [Salix purpurea]
MSARRRPLHTCGVSFMGIARKAYTETQEFNGPLGLLTKKMIRLAPFASLLVYVLQYEYIFLAILSFVDDHIILALERKVEAIFPPSKYAFNEVDKLVQIVETLPAKIDFAVGKLPVIFHQIPFLDWAHSCAISWLNFWLSILTHWGSRTTHEKEIVVDINCNDSSDEQTNVQADKNIVEFQDETKGCFSPMSATSGSETEASSPNGKRCTYKDALEKVVKSTYKDALEKGTGGSTEGSPKQMIRSTFSSEATSPKGEKNESMKAKECIADEQTEEASASKEETGEGGDHTAAMEDDPVDLPADKKPESIGKEDPILALFESAWHI